MPGVIMSRSTAYGFSAIVRAQRLESCLVAIACTGPIFYVKKFILTILQLRQVFGILLCATEFFAGRLYEYQVGLSQGSRDSCIYLRHGRDPECSLQTFARSQSYGASFSPDAVAYTYRHLSAQVS